MAPQAAPPKTTLANVSWPGFVNRRRVCAKLTLDFNLWWQAGSQRVQLLLDPSSQRNVVEQCVCVRGFAHRKGADQCVHEAHSLRQYGSGTAVVWWGKVWLACRCMSYVSKPTPLASNTVPQPPLLCMHGTAMGLAIISHVQLATAPAERRAVGVD